MTGFENFIAMKHIEKTKHNLKYNQEFTFISNRTRKKAKEQVTNAIWHHCSTPNNEAF